MISSRVGDPPGEGGVLDGRVEPTAADEVESLRRRLIAAVRRTCPAWLAANVEDIVQNALTQLVASPRAGEGNRTFSSTYLAKAAYGATVDEIRRACRRREDIVANDDVFGRTPDSAAGPERLAASAEIARGLQDCLTRLVRPRRLAVTLYLEGASVPRAATLLRWSPKRTENLVYRGLADLRRCLKTKGLEP